MIELNSAIILLQIFDRKVSIYVTEFTDAIPNRTLEVTR